MRLSLFILSLLLSPFHVMAADSDANVPKILVLPYLQPGPKPASDGYDAKVIHWFTDQTPGDFTLEYQARGGALRNVVPTHIALGFRAAESPTPPVGGGEKKPSTVKKATESAKSAEKKEGKVPLPLETDQRYFKYTACLTDLPLNSDVRYRVSLGAKVIREAIFRTVATPDESVRCVLVGDLAQGRPQQREVAHCISTFRPEFLVALGDIAYPTGRVNQYMEYYWGTYNNVVEATSGSGAPLMASVPFYPVLGNHDISAKLKKVPDALGIYYFFSPPQNGPGEGPWVTPLDGDSAVIASFRASAKNSYPYIDAYSFDYGPGHFVVLNVNPKMDLNAPILRKWLKEDLQKANGRWKFVCYHMPAFHSSLQHYGEQQARVLEPLFEEMGVTMTFAGHVHNYQRSLPLRFLPGEKQGSAMRIDGGFTLDTVFDGVKNTQPAGVIHIVAGGGGATLYGPGLDKTKDALKKQYGDNYADFTAKTVVDQHSFVVLDLAPDRIDMRAISAAGNELDRISVTKTK